MRWLGIDPAVAKPIAVAWIDEHDGPGWDLLPVSFERGAARLWRISYEINACMRSLPLTSESKNCVIEIPWGKTSNFDLLSCAGVAGVAVWDHVEEVEYLATQTWKKESVGKGNCTAADYLKHSRLLGYRGSSVDIAAALCMAQVARQRWEGAMAAPPALSA